METEADIMISQTLINKPTCYCQFTSKGWIKLHTSKTVRASVPMMKRKLNETRRRAHSRSLTNLVWYLVTIIKPKANIIPYSVL